MAAPNKKNGKKDNFLAEMGTDDAMFERKENIVLFRNKYSFGAQERMFVGQCVTGGYKMPLTGTLMISRTGNFSQPI